MTPGKPLTWVKIKRYKNHLELRGGNVEEINRLESSLEARRDIQNEEARRRITTLLEKRLQETLIRGLGGV